VLGERHPDTAATYNNMAEVCDAQGRHAEALEYYAKVLAIMRDVRGEQHPDTAGTCFNMAITHRKLGDMAHARELFGKAHEIFHAAMLWRMALTIMRIQQWRGRPPPNRFVLTFPSSFFSPFLPT
jgi:tetratricopeptide (TPR) repeat protein